MTIVSGNYQCNYFMQILDGGYHLETGEAVSEVPVALPVFDAVTHQEEWKAQQEQIHNCHALLIAKAIAYRGDNSQLLANVKTMKTITYILSDATPEESHEFLLAIVRCQTSQMLAFANFVESNCTNNTITQEVWDIIKRNVLSGSLVLDDFGTLPKVIAEGWCSTWERICLPDYLEDADAESEADVEVE